MKSIVKNTLYLICAIIVSPLTLIYHILNVLLNSDTLFSSFAQFLCLIPGKVGVYIRAAGFYRFVLKYCAPDAVISFLVLFSQRDTEIASGVYIGPQCNIGKCSIENDVLLGSGVHIMSGKNQHNFEDLNQPIKDQGGEFTKVRIGKNSWIGNGALIMANVGSGSIVAAGSVVVNDLPDNVIAAGNPAKVIKSRV